MGRTDVRAGGQLKSADYRPMLFTEPKQRITALAGLAAMP
jgi:hypothetical protein